MSGYDYLRYDVRDVHESAPTFDERGFRLRLGRASGGRSGRAVPFGSFGGIVVATAVMMAVAGPPLSWRVVGVFGAVLLVGLVLTGVAARIQFARAEVVCEDGHFFGRRSWLGGMTEVWPIAEVRSFAPHVRKVRWTEIRRAWASEHMAWSVSACGDGTELDLDLSLRPEQARRLAADLDEALSELRVRQASARGFRG